jgi:chemotaxis protein MotB
MARKKTPEKPANHERWLVSYGDFITLLFAVFVTLYAMSQTDKKKVDQVAASYRTAFGITSGAGTSSSNVLQSSELMPIPSLDAVPRQVVRPKRTSEESEDKQKAVDLVKKPQISADEFQDIKKAIRVSLKPLQLSGDVAVEESSRGLVIRMEEEAFFDAGSATVKPEAFPLLGKIARAILPYSEQIRIEGHTDNTPIATNRYKSNWELSLARATSILHIFLTNYDFSPVNLAIAGYGQYRPIAGNDTEEGRRRNRRVDIVLLKTNSEGPVP